MQSLRHLNDLCLEQYLHLVTQGQYALYQVHHQGEFAVAGLRRIENGHWEIDEIRSKGNSEPFQPLMEFVAAWHPNHPVNSPKPRSPTFLAPDVVSRLPP